MNFCEYQLRDVPYSLVLEETERVLVPEQSDACGELVVSLPKLYCCGHKIKDFYGERVVADWKGYTAERQAGSRIPINIRAEDGRYVLIQHVLRHAGVHHVPERVDGRVATR